MTEAGREERLEYRALIYTRPRTRKYFHFLGNHVFAPGKVTYFSDHKWTESLYLMEPFYRWYERYRAEKDQIPLLPEEEVEDIIARCRFLRSLERRQAVAMVSAMWRTAQHILDKCDPDVIIGLPIDSYVLDIVERVARARQIPYLELVASFINGYSRFASRGQLLPIREPSVEEIERAYQQLLASDYLPAYVGQRGRTMATLFFRYYLKDKLKKLAFDLLRTVQRDPLQFNYSAFRRNPLDRMTCESLLHVWAQQYFETGWSERCREQDGRLKVFLPLQFYPEATIDYWTLQREFIRFYEVINQALEALGSDCLVLVKEHPSALGYRPPHFYRKLKAHSNVVLVPCEIPSSVVMEEADAVLTWGTTTGFEAALRRKLVVTFGRPYYDTEGAFVVLSSVEEASGLPSLIRNRLGKNKLQDPRLLLSTVLAGCFRGNVRPLDIEAERASDSEDAVTVAKSITCYLPRLLNPASPIGFRSARHTE